MWPEHGIPRTVMVDRDAMDGPMTGASGPAIVPETLVIDHGKIYISDHLTSVCRRMGISIQPARLRTGRDKGPVERFFRTLREDLLQALPGYKGPDVHSRGADPESDAFFYLDELEDMIRQWVAVVYHHRPHDGLIDPHIPKLRFSPVQMFEHGLARAGYIEAPRDPDLGYEFLKTGWRRIQHYGVDFDGRRYNGAALDPYRGVHSPYAGRACGRWPIHYDPDDVTRAYFRDPHTRRWHTLIWGHAPALHMALSEDALRYARRKAAEKYRYPDDRLAIDDLLERWNLGLGATLAERRIALRLAREESLITPDPDLPPEYDGGDGQERMGPDADADAVGGDDDDEDTAMTISTPARSWTPDGTPGDRRRAAIGTAGQSDPVPQGGMARVRQRRPARATRTAHAPCGSCSGVGVGVGVGGCRDPGGGLDLQGRYRR